MNLEWRCNTKQLLAEILTNNTCAVLKHPLNILLGILTQVAIRASELNDKELNKLMLRLSLYDISNPEDKNFDLEKTLKYIES